VRARVVEALLYVEDFEPRPPGVEVGEVQRVAVAEARRIEPLPVVVDDGGAVDDLVAAVRVHVADGEVVVALPAERLVARRAVFAVERPDARELPRAPVPGGQDGARVVAARHHEARAFAVEVSDAGEKTVNAVAVAVAPDGGQLLGRRVELRRMARRDEVRRGEGRARQAVEDGEVLRPFEHVAGEGVPPVAEGGEGAFGVAPVGARVADDFAAAVRGAVGGLARDLGSAVAVEVVDHELRVVRALADVPAEADRPEQRAVEPVSLEDGLGREARAPVVAPPARHVYDQLVLAVAVEVAGRGVARRVARRRLQGYRKVLPRGRVGREGEGRARLTLLAFHD
jgi:hypothetical protein